MAKRKTQTEAATATTDGGADDIYTRVGLFFQSLPYRQPGTMGELSQDLPDVELRKYFKDEEQDAKLAELEKQSFQLPKAKAERGEVARQKLLEGVIDEMLKDGRLTRVAVSDKNRPDDKSIVGMGYIWNGERPKEAVGRLARLPIDQIKVDERVQQRANGINVAVVDDYAAHADQLPAARVWHTPEDEYILSRGFQRMAAWRKAGMQEVPVEIMEGDRNAAILDAIGDNASHGLRRTKDDIAKAVGTFLAMKGNAMASTAVIAKAVNIGWQTARDYARRWRKAQADAREERKRRGEQTAADAEAEVAETSGTVKTADGREYPASIEQPANAGNKVEPGPGSGMTQTATTDPLPPVAHPHGIKDKIGNDVPPELAGAFADTRISDKCGEIYRALQFIREMRTDGYAASALSVKDRDSICATIETEVQTLAYSTPFAVTPKDATGKPFAGARERGWMTQDEHADYVKAKATKGGNGRGRRPKDGAAAEVPAEPAPTDSNSQVESFPVADQTADNPSEVPADADTATAA
jgi:hypothetical protein